ncbi:hypothetical protein V6705_22905, partial [Klebsiella pneumoniae]
MSNLPEQIAWESGIHQLEQADRAKAGPGGVLNIQATQLANRTRWLRAQVESVEDYREYTFYKSESDPDGTITGLANTPAGKIFRVAQGLNGDLAFIYYLNDDGVAVPITSLLGRAAITSTIRQYSTLTLAENDVSAGNILDGSSCWLTDSSDETLAAEYINNAGTLQPTGRKMPSQKTVDDLLKHVETTNLIFQLVDILGYRQFYALTSGEFGTIKTRIKPDGIELEGFSLTVSADNGIFIENILGQRIVLVDENGNVAPRSLRAARDGSFGTDSAMVSGGGLSFNSG